MPVEASLIQILACPACHAPLEDRTADEPAELICTSADCGLAYPVRDGIPVLLVDEALPHSPKGVGGAPSPA
ncbi:Trm112 family protein [Streptomyces sp. GS7]|uniref:Trm112 family protein n=1 Tax=Streptomyces sp. GS7 TaxID=2692234 RepID=UPI0013170C80|nr:Trm112 family protein [Streptomyces sp. GS7]QHC20780.1 Trm112 family protein [Streptomyces sp. GS7]